MGGIETVPLFESYVNDNYVTQLDLIKRLYRIPMSLVTIKQTLGDAGLTTLERQKQRVLEIVLWQVNI